MNWKFESFLLKLILACNYIEINSYIMIVINETVQKYYQLYTRLIRHGDVLRVTTRSFFVLLFSLRSIRVAAYDCYYSIHTCKQILPELIFKYVYEILYRVSIANLRSFTSEDLSDALGEIINYADGMKTTCGWFHTVNIGS